MTVKNNNRLGPLEMMVRGQIILLFQSVTFVDATVTFTMRNPELANASTDTNTIHFFVFFKMLCNIPSSHHLIYSCIHFYSERAGNIPLLDKETTVYIVTK